LPHSAITGVIGFTALIVIFVILSSSTMVLGYEYTEKIVKKELEAIGSSIASQIVEAVSLAYDLLPGESILIMIKMPKECSLGHYTVTLNNSTLDNGKIILILKPVTYPRPEVVVPVPLSTNLFKVLPSSIYSGSNRNYINITATDSEFQIKLIYMRGS